MRHTPRNTHEALRPRVRHMPRTTQTTDNKRTSNDITFFMQWGGNDLRQDISSVARYLRLRAKLSKSYKGKENRV